MKVYVEDNNISNLDDLFQATNSYECWAGNCGDDLEIVSLADYTKQVRKEVCEEIREKIKDNICVVLGDYNYYTLKYYETEVCKIDIINDILDQIKEDG